MIFSHVSITYLWRGTVCHEWAASCCS